MRTYSVPWTKLLTTRATDRDVMKSIAIRVAAGIAGALPALLALAWLDRAAFGHAMANFAWALLLTGPIARFIGQGYLRDLLTAGKQESAPPRGSIYIHLYVLACTVPACALALSGVMRWVDAAFVMACVVIVVLFRVQESWFVAERRPTTAIMLFYFIPPLLHAALIVAVKPLALFDQFWLVATTQVAAHGISVAASVLMQSRRGRRFLLPHPPARQGWSAEFASVRQFFASGGLLSATEQLPVISLNALGFGAFIPVFEVARKLASVPEVLIHALHMHMTPRLVSYASAGKWSDLRRLLRDFTLTSGDLGCRYIALAIAGLYVLSILSPHGLHIDFPIFAILFSAAILTSFFAPLGSLVTVLRGDIWWTVGGGVSLAIQFLVSLFAVRGLGPIAIPLSVLAQVVVLRAITGTAAVLLLTRREKVYVPRPAN